MRTREILGQIESAVADEAKSGRLRGVLAQAAYFFGRDPNVDDLDAAMRFVVEYIRHVPVLLDAVQAAGRKAGVLPAVQPLLDFCEDYWFTVMDVIPDHLGLAGYLDDAYCVLSVLQGANDRTRQASAVTLMNIDLTPVNQAMRTLIGEPEAARLDEMIASALSSRELSAIEDAGTAMYMELLSTQSYAIPLEPDSALVEIDPIWGDAPMADMVGSGLGTLGIETVGRSASMPPLSSVPYAGVGVGSGAGVGTGAGTASASDDFDMLSIDEVRSAPPPVKRNGGTQNKLHRVTPQRADQPISTGFATVAEPGGYLGENAPLVAGKRYYFWLEIGQVAGSIEETPTAVPVNLLPASARLVVVLFTPDGGFRVNRAEDLGKLDLNPDGTITVAAQPARRHANADAELLGRRLLFPLRAPRKAGSCRLRCSIYCRGVLVQSRLVDVQVGGTRRVSRVDFTLATKLDPSQLQALTEHRFSLMSNHGSGDNHDFYVCGVNGAETFRDSITIPVATVTGALEIARTALRRASWGDENAWDASKTYRYAGAPRVETLREDLALLAIAGWRIYDLLANQLAGGKRNLPKFEAMVRQPGLVQISPDDSVGMVLPAALIYDYRIATQAGPPSSYALCAEFERAFHARVPLEQTACFQGHCPSRGLATTVCPSGFWGFRHGLGFPISDVEAGEEREAAFSVRLEYDDVPLIVLGVSRARDLPRTKTHTEELKALKPAWGNRGWLVTDRLDPLLDAMRSKRPHVVYLYCHGSGRQAGATEIPMLFLGENPQNAKPGEWLERAMLRGDIEWTTPRPLVFLNGCHTTVLDSRTTLDFVTGFVQNSNACGVVGTEVTVFESLAGEFATRFMARFLDGMAVGQAVRDARLDLLRDGNPLGLVYTPFVLSGTQLVRRRA